MNILFYFENDPFSCDLATQYARMALSVSMDHKVTMIYRNEAVALSRQPFFVPVKEFNYFDHERFLVEQEIDMFVFLDDSDCDNDDMKDSVDIITHKELIELYRKQDLIFRN